MSIEQKPMGDSNLREKEREPEKIAFRHQEQPQLEGWQKNLEKREIRKVVEPILKAADLQRLHIQVVELNPEDCKREFSPIHQDLNKQIFNNEEKKPLIMCVLAGGIGGRISAFLNYGYMETEKGKPSLLSPVKNTRTLMIHDRDTVKTLIENMAKYLEPNYLEFYLRSSFDINQYERQH